MASHPYSSGGIHTCVWGTRQVGQPEAKLGLSELLLAAGLDSRPSTATFFAAAADAASPTVSRPGPPRGG